MNLLDGLVPSIVAKLSDTGFLGTTKKIAIEISAGYDPLTGEEEEQEAINDIACFPPLNYNVNLIDETRIKSSDLKILIPAENWENLPTEYGTEPTTAMNIIIEDKKFSIISIKKTNTGNANALFELQARAV